MLFKEPVNICWDIFDGEDIKEKAGEMYVTCIRGDVCDMYTGRCM